MKKINGYIKSYEEACLIVHAVRLGAIKLTTERLGTIERENIESGSIYCFIENEAGMKRWTDGRVWSPSKICGEFLVYQEVPRYLSKNSIKKRKDTERSPSSCDSPYVSRRSSRGEMIDRTVMHKKTISIRHNDQTYHIIAYYRPIFSNSTLSDISYFQKLSTALAAYPELTRDDYLKKEMAEDQLFFEHHNLERKINGLTLDSGKRNMLEQIALEVLTTLGRIIPRRRQRVIYQQE